MEIDGSSEPDRASRSALAAVGHSPGRRRARARTAITAALLSLLFAATAAAQVSPSADPYATTEQHAKQNDLDTDLTPVAKETELWGLVHGARFGETEPVPDSLTTFDTDLFAVSFENRRIGLAGGSACAVAPERQEGEQDADFGRRASRCEAADGARIARVPALFRYTEPRSGDPRWERLSLPADDEPGYVGAIAWIDSERALVVGGTGGYPRREPEADGLDPTDPEKADGAGEARAWIYSRQSDSVEEIDLSAHTDDEPSRAGMRGFVAVDCFRDPEVTPNERKIALCFAAGLGQIWEWRDGAFTGKRVDASSPKDDLVNADLFRYRVRDIQFAAVEPPVARAVTSGCCADDQTKNVPRVLTYVEGPANEPVRQWTVHRHMACLSTDWWSILRDTLGPGKFCAEEVSGEADAALKEASPRPDLPDSYYSLAAGSIIATPGGPPSDGEPSSVIAWQGSFSDQFVTVPSPPPYDDRFYTTLSTARLLDGDGDNWSSAPITRQGRGSPSSPGAIESTPKPQGDGRPDWNVGQLRSTLRPGLGARGLLVATALPPGLTDGVNVRPYLGGRPLPDLAGLDRPTVEEIATGWDPADEEKVDGWRRSRHFLLPSYSANSVQIIGAEQDGWAVGDRGAILRLRSEKLQDAASAAEPPPPRLGSGQRETISDRSAYEDSEPGLPASAGSLPPLAQQSIELEEPRFVASTLLGSRSGTITEIVMSRDGSEGWAIGNDRGAAVFYRFDGSTWSYCDPLGLEGLVPPDPACEAMAPLQGYYDENDNFQKVRLQVASRVPLENDSDPTNDDELEILAAGTSYRGPETGNEKLQAVVRYRDGKWQFEEPSAVRQLTKASSGFLDMAFSGPGHGWLLAKEISTTRLFYFDGTRWLDCGVPEPGCASLDRVPTGTSGGATTEISGLTASGDRIYLFGGRVIGRTASSASFLSERWVPLILYHERGGEWTDGSAPDEDGAGFDPGYTDPATEEAGYVDSVSVVNTPQGLEGWAVGRFGTGTDTEVVRSAGATGLEAVLMRLDRDGWTRYRSPGALEDHMVARLAGSDRIRRSSPGAQVTYPSADHPDGAFIGHLGGGRSSGHIFGFDSDRERFGLIDSARPQGFGNFRVGPPRPAGALHAMAPDGQGGFWAAVSGHMFHYTDRVPRPLFEEVASPLGSRGAGLRSIAAAPDGAVWAASDSNAVFRFDRRLGWEEVRIPGWDPGRIVTRPSAANAVAVGADGEGLVVGEAGRIAEISPRGVSLDPAAGTSCALGDPVPCGTSRDLIDVDISPDGSAIAVGKRLSLLWRPAGGEFRAIDRPPASSGTNLEAVSHPRADRAYVVSDNGLLFRGDLAAGKWTWRVENEDDRGDLVSADSAGKPLGFHDIAVDAGGHGYAVGEQALVLERVGGRWRRLEPPVAEHFTVVELAHGDTQNALIGGHGGLILAGRGPDFHIVREGEFSGGSVADFAYMPGSTEGSVDAWAALGGGASTNRLLRYRSDPGDPSVNPTATARILPDAPPRRGGELSIAAFGKSDCDLAEERLCPEMSATTTTNELVPERIIDELAAMSERGEIDLGLQTGDVTDSAGPPAGSLLDLERTGSAGVLQESAFAGQLKHRRYTELVADELESKGVPLLAAIGGQDLTETFACDPYTGDCETTKRTANAGENFAWREAFAGRMEPWGDGEELVDAGDGDVANAPGASGSDYEFIPVRGAEDGSIRIEDQKADADGEGPAPEAKAEIGGANTHYAVEAIREGERVARIVFVDTSMRSLQASDPLQQPQEPLGGQARFLERMICKQGGTTSTGDECTRAKDQAAIVVSNTPTYSYGPGALTHTATDANVFEALVLKHDVDLVISGALGYNGLYYTLAPGIHEPCPGGEHPEGPPKGGLPSCAGGTDSATAPLEEQGLPNPQELLEEQGITGAVPTLIASGAGGKFGPDGHQQADGPAGQWHGYSIARLQPDGELIVEQRPILDWIGMDAADHTLHARSRLTLNGYGRSPISTAIESGARRAFHYDIANAAITHRYDLLLADPDRPWLPCEAGDPDCQALHAKLSVKPGEPLPTSKLASAEEPANASAAKPDSASKAQNPCAPYLCLPERIATVDRLSGEVKAGDGKYPETFAVAMLSVDDKVATYPLVFKPSPSFVVTPFEGPPQLPANAQPAAPPPPSLPKPQIPSLTLPTPPTLPAIPPLVAATPPEPAPPAPPAPPPPSEQPSPLNLSVAPTGLTVAAPTAVIQPPTPPVNPAPPGGARREARQRQAAAQKSGADADEAQHEGMDLADGPPKPEGSQEMTRHEFSRLDRTGFASGFSPARSRSRGSVWTGGALYGGGITLLAFALAIGWTHGRPTPRRRQPDLPAAAWASAPRRRR